MDESQINQVLDKSININNTTVIFKNLITELTHPQIIEVINHLQKINFNIVLVEHTYFSTLGNRPFKITIN